MVCSAAMTKIASCTSILVSLAGLLWNAEAAGQTSEELLAGEPLYEIDDTGDGCDEIGTWSSSTWTCRVYGTVHGPLVLHSGVTLECDEDAILLADPATTNVYVASESEDVTITGCAIVGGKYGIAIEGAIGTISVVQNQFYEVAELEYSFGDNVIIAVPTPADLNIVGNSINAPNLPLAESEDSETLANYLDADELMPSVGVAIFVGSGDGDILLDDNSVIARSAARLATDGAITLTGNDFETSGATVVAAEAGTASLLISANKWSGTTGEGTAVMLLSGLSAFDHNVVTGYEIGVDFHVGGNHQVTRNTIYEQTTLGIHGDESAFAGQVWLNDFWGTQTDVQGEFVFGGADGNFWGHRCSEVFTVGDLFVQGVDALAENIDSSPFAFRVSFMATQDLPATPEDVLDACLDDVDDDDDGVVLAYDNCADVANVFQEDVDADQLGDVCDNCPAVSNNNQDDTDSDLIGDACDNCEYSNPDQQDYNGDGIGDACLPDIELVASSEFAIASAVGYEYAPRIGADATSRLVVFNRVEFTTTGFPLKRLYYRRFGASPTGSAYMISNGTNSDCDEMPSTDGDYIVFASYPSIVGDAAVVTLFEISSGASSPLSELTFAYWPQVHGELVAWAERYPQSSRIMLLDLQLIPYSAGPIQVAGPSVGTSSFGMSDRLLVYTKKVSSQTDVHAYDLAAESTSVVSDTAGRDYRPSTDGPWIVWNTDVGYSLQIWALNVDTSEERLITGTNSLNVDPRVRGDWVAYSSNFSGNFEIYLYRLSTGYTYRVTDTPGLERSPDVLDDSVTYQRDGDIFVSNFEAP
jgi:hypothetical protein